MPAPESKDSWVYIAELENGQLYVGITDDIDRRTTEHLQGKRSTRTTYVSQVVRVLYKERHPDRSSALRRERQLKGWTRAKKLALACGDLGALKELARSRSRRSTAKG